MPLPRFTRLALAFGFAVTAFPTIGLADAAPDEARAEACKRAMNARIQVCTDECTARALAAASHYTDTNNNVKFGCLKGCALGQVFQMKVCRDGGSSTQDPTETNAH
jgi:hypothetical protein